MPAFISHSQKDQAIYSSLCLAFDGAGIVRWDPQKLSPGESLAEQLRQAISQCEVCVFIVTHSSLASPWCLAELGAFWGASKKVILYVADPNLQESDLPPQFRGNLWTNHAQRLLNEVQKAIGDFSRYGKRINDRPGNLFWLGHDLARAIRFAMFEEHPSKQLVYELTQALHHLDEVGVEADDERIRLIDALRTVEQISDWTEERREEVATKIAAAKNDLGQKIARLQQGFRARPSLRDVE